MTSCGCPSCDADRQSLMCLPIAISLKAGALRRVPPVERPRFGTLPSHLIGRTSRSASGTFCGAASADADRPARPARTSPIGDPLPRLQVVGNEAREGMLGREGAGWAVLDDDQRARRDFQSCERMRYGPCEVIERRGRLLAASTVVTGPGTGRQAVRAQVGLRARRGSRAASMTTVVRGSASLASYGMRGPVATE